jgi:F-type H+-transporting ATPase subunit gamma
MENVDVLGFAGKKHMFILVTTDKGLCGGTNAVVLRWMRNTGKKMIEAQKDFNIFVIGDKGKSQMEKMFSKQFVGFVDTCYPKTGLTFSQASAIATRICASAQFDTATITHNIFRVSTSFVFKSVIRPLISIF